MSRGARARHRRSARRANETTTSSLVEVEGVSKAPDLDQPAEALTADATEETDDTTETVVEFAMPECAGCEHAYTDHLGTTGPCTLDDCSCTSYASGSEENALLPPIVYTTTTTGTSAVTFAPAVEEAPDMPPPREDIPKLRPGPAAPAATQPSPLAWEATFAPEGTPTDDGRMFAPGALSWRDLPLSLMAMLETAAGHDGAKVSGRIDNIFRDGNLIKATGVFDDGDFGTNVARLVRDGTLRGLSVDIAIVDSKPVLVSQITDEDGNIDQDALQRALESNDEEGEDEPSLLDLLFDGEEMLYVVTDGIIGAATVCPFPAFADANISMQASAHPTIPIAIRLTLDRALEVQGSLTASAAPERPPAWWFEDPELDEPTPLIVEDDGRIYGHAAAWETCHIGLPGGCTVAPHSNTNYAYFHLGVVRTDDDEDIAVGKITLDTNHADRAYGRAAAASHYDHTGTVVGYIRAGEDEHGIWVAGSLNPYISEQRAAELRSANLSGDWRNVDGNLELVALLAVNVPGFPIPRTRALVAAGSEGWEVQTLVAAGIVGDEEEELTAFEIAKFQNLALIASKGLSGLFAREES